MVYDCFLFLNELMLLELRMEELGDWVDKFVIVEASRTHQNNPKPFVFEENRDKFSKWEDKIIHIKVEDINEPNPRENHKVHRQHVMDALTECNDDDIILLCDVDEIPDLPAVVPNPINKSIFTLKLRTFYYNFNTESNEVSTGPKIGPYGEMKNTPMWKVRQGKYPIIEDAGWHFSYVADADGIRYKIASFLHHDLNTASNRNHLSERMSTLKDPFGRNIQLHVTEIDHTFPKTILNNRDKYGHFIRK